MIDERLIVAWLGARSISRGLPAPVPDHGGWRVDSDLPEERRRYVFANPAKGLRALGEVIDEPFVALKLCRAPRELRALLPDRWRIQPEATVMLRDVAPAETPDVPTGYRLELDDGDVRQVRILFAGELAATGYAIERDGVFIYDRIVTQEAHRRRGLGRAMIAALGATRSPASREILTATVAGRALYLQLGWRDYAPYSTALIPQILPGIPRGGGKFA